MTFQSPLLSPSAFPELLNIDAEYNSNLRYLLGLQSIDLNNKPSPIFGNFQPKNFVNGKSTENSPIVYHDFEMPSLVVLPNGNDETPQKSCALRPVLEESSAKVNTMSSMENGVPGLASQTCSINVRETARYFHTSFFQDENIDSKKPVDIRTSTSPNQSNCRLKRSVSARIQSLAGNFEAADSPDTEALPLSSDALEISNDAKTLESQTKLPTESCFSCKKVIYPLDRVSTGSHAYHKLCLRCSVCDRNLSTVTCETSKDELFCRPHFLEIVHGICCAEKA